MVVLQFFFWGIVFQRLAWSSVFQKTVPTTVSKPLPPVSIIICARNEAANLQKNLESILTQDYLIYEVVVVNDASEDQTAEVLANWQTKYPHLRVVTVEEKRQQGKKGALAIGIEQVQYDWLLLTDADCWASSTQWVKAMLTAREGEATKLVLGYGPYAQNATWVNRWVRLETVYVAIQYFSMALWGQTYMGVGRNLCYHKELYTQANGFKTHEHLASGDDDLLVNAVATKQNTAICLAQESFMYSPSPANWKALYRQKTRHYSSSTAYRWHFKIILAALSASHCFFYLGILGFLGGNVFNSAIFVILTGRLLVVNIVYYRYLKQTQAIALWPYVVLFDLLLPIYYIIFGLALLKPSPTHWK